jgi:hypothetical protein
MDFEQFLRKDFFLSLHVKYHLQWNVSSINKSDIPFIFMGVEGDFLH